MKITVIVPDGTNAVTVTAVRFDGMKVMAANVEDGDTLDLTKEQEDE